MFTEGRKVWCKKYGEGVVSDVEDRYPYRVEVFFLNGERACYTSYGKLNVSDAEPSLSVIDSSKIFKPGQVTYRHKVGDEVFTLRHGRGTVTRIIEDALWYPVQVTFHDGSVVEFTYSGKQFIVETRPSLLLA